LDLLISANWPQGERKAFFATFFRNPICRLVSPEPSPGGGGKELWCLVLVNAGVKLAVAGWEVLANLQELERGGVVVLVCGTCLNHFQLLEQKQVGETTNMLDIVTHMQLADKVIPLT